MAGDYRLLNKEADLCLPTEHTKEHGKKRRVVTILFAFSHREISTLMASFSHLLCFSVYSVCQIKTDVRR